MFGQIIDLARTERRGDFQSYYRSDAHRIMRMSDVLANFPLLYVLKIAIKLE